MREHFLTAYIRRVSGARLSFRGSGSVVCIPQLFGEVLRYSCLGDASYRLSAPPFAYRGVQSTASVKVDTNAGILETRSCRQR